MAFLLQYYTKKGVQIHSECFPIINTMFIAKHILLFSDFTCLSMNRDVFSARAIYATAPYYESLLPFWRYYQKPINSTAHGYQYIFRPETDFNKKKRKSRNDWCHDPTTYRKSFKKVTLLFNDNSESKIFPCDI